LDLSNRTRLEHLSVEEIYRLNNYASKIISLDLEVNLFLKITHCFIIIGVPINTVLVLKTLGESFERHTTTSSLRERERGEREREKERER
jgi:hypothetical protein